MKNNRGVALFMTLALISVLTAAALEVGRRAGKAASRSTAALELFQARQTAWSGIQLAMAILAADAEKNEIDSLQEDWASPEKLAMAVAALEIPRGSLNLSITDELGKIQVNALLDAYPGNAFNENQRQLWERMLGLIISGDKSRDDRDPAEIINALKDWLDSGDDDAVTGISGAETDYYESLDPPVFCTNGPLTTLDELYFVKGVSDNFLEWGKADMASGLVDNDDLSMTPSGTDVQIGQFFSIHGMAGTRKKKGRFSFSGLININTAGEEVLSFMLPTGMEDEASALVAFRLEQEPDSERFINALDKGWYEQVIQLSEKEKKAFESIITYSSHLFGATAVADLNGRMVTLTGIIKREKQEKTGAWSCRLLELLTK
ncbi:type II secretion system minor pseudopilin [Desulfocicer vacuolatum]|nr:type II secretion system protein GspK [Desulfocicer vacuolatum]